MYIVEQGYPAHGLSFYYGYGADGKMYRWMAFWEDAIDWTIFEEVPHFGF